MTRLIVVMHGILDTRTDITELVERSLPYSSQKRIVDLCSGNGGPMPDVIAELPEDVSLELTDLYPDQQTASRINSSSEDNISYRTDPVDATSFSEPGLRTMICSFHHMKPEVAKGILKSASVSGEPIVLYEISDNSMPLAIAWLALPVNIIMSLFVTVKARPVTWYQLLFTYLIPVIPLFFAWDGAVSNVRTYTLKDLDKLLEGLEREDYVWEKGIINRKSKKIFMIGRPVNQSSS